MWLFRSVVLESTLEVDFNGWVGVFRRRKGLISYLRHRVTQKPLSHTCKRKSSSIYRNKSLDWVISLSEWLTESKAQINHHLLEHWNKKQHHHYCKLSSLKVLLSLLLYLWCSGIDIQMDLMEMSFKRSTEANVDDDDSLNLN